MPQGGAGYNPYSKYPDIGGLAREFMQNMMMKKQMQQQQQQQMWQRGMEEKKQESLEAYRGAQMEAMGQPKQPSIPARVQEAIIASGQGGVLPGEINYGDVGKILDKWRTKAPGKQKEPGMKKARGDWLKGLDRDIDGRIKNITAMPAYGMDETLATQIGNLQQAKTKIREAQAIGADMPLSDTLWKELGKISGRLKEIEKKGLYPPKKGKSPWKNAIDVELGGKTLQLSPSKKLLWDGTKVIPQNPDGTFTIGGEKYKLG